MHYPQPRIRLPLHAPRQTRRCAFTLIELLVVVAIIALLIAILLPSLARAREQARTVRCLSNMRGMEMASILYAQQNDDYFIQAGLSHVGGTADLGVAWINTLQAFYSNKLLARCPSDLSPFWDTLVPGTNPPSMRLTSYGVNDFLDPVLCPWPIGGYPKYRVLPNPTATVHFIEMTQGLTAASVGFAASDHPHVENWNANPPVIAASQLQINVHGGPDASPKAMANYGFADGRAETLHFAEVYKSPQFNRFDPLVAH